MVPNNNSTHKFHVSVSMLYMNYIISLSRESIPDQVQFKKKKKSNHFPSPLEAFSRASYYQWALEHLRSHPEALEALGTPLNVHYLRLTDKYNFVDIADAKVTCSPCELQAGCLLSGGGAAVLRKESWRTLEKDVGWENPLRTTAARWYLAPFKKALWINLFSYSFLPFWGIDVARKALFVFRSPS